MRNNYRALLFLALLFCQHIVSHCEVNPDPQQALENLGETHEFQAEIGRLMDIIINSLYTNKDVFLREVISNASDALDKIRFLAVSDPTVLDTQQKLEIRVEFDAEAKTVTIQDSGIGMTKQDLINNLGTIAKSGTTNFVEALAKGQSLNLIGQFGVGFYSTFLAGNKVTVTSKNNRDDQHVWQSSAANSFHITKDTTGEQIGRGTKIVIDLKSDAEEFANEAKLKELIKRYSEFISFPIYLKVQKDVTREVTEDEPTPSTETAEPTETEKKDDDGLEIKDAADEEKGPKTKTITEKVWDWELINDNKAVWLRSKDELTTEDYDNFYVALTKDYQSPLKHIHFTAEGDVEFKSILFVPGHAPQDIYENYYAKVSTLKLYVRRVLINEKFEELLPKYLNFIKGVIDSDDLPINVSRESLQQVKMLKVMGAKLVKKALEMIKNLAEAKEDDEESDDEDATETDDATKKDDAGDETGDDAGKKTADKEAKRQERLEKYDKFWTEFGKNIKLGVIEDAKNRKKLIDLTRWYTSHNTSKLSSFEDYISRMKPEQEHIYYFGGESKDSLMKAPAIQRLLKGGYEVLLLDDPIDEFCLQNVYDYETKEEKKYMLVNVGKGTFIPPSSNDYERKRVKKIKSKFEPLTKWWKSLLPEQLDTVTVSERLVDDPCIIVGSVYGHSAFMEKVQKAQAYGPNNPMANSKRNLEINPGHPVIRELFNRVEAEPEAQETKEMATLLYEAALLNSGYSLADPREFSTRFFKIFNPAMGIPRDAKVEEVEVDVGDEDEADQTTTSGGGNFNPGMKETVSDHGINIQFDEPPNIKEKRENSERKKKWDEEQAAKAAARSGESGDNADPADTSAADTASGDNADLQSGERVHTINATPRQSESEPAETQQSEPEAPQTQQSEPEASQTQQSDPEPQQTQQSDPEPAQTQQPEPEETQPGGARNTDGVDTPAAGEGQTATAPPGHTEIPNADHNGPTPINTDENQASRPVDADL